MVASPTLALSQPDDQRKVTLFHVANRHVPADSPGGELASPLWTADAEY